jgi:site-specific DNA recombinase
MDYYHDPDNLIVVENAHEAIIEADTFYKVQQIRKSRNTFKIRTGGRPQGSDYILTGIFFCEHCGYKYTGWTCTHKNKKYFYYKDSGSNQKGDKFCKQKLIPRDSVNDFAIKKIKKRLRSDF